MTNSTKLSNKKKKKRAYIKALNAKIERKRQDPLKYAEQHPKQEEATNASEMVRVLFWGNRVGKTEWGAQEVTRYLLEKHPKRKIVGPVEIWSACPSYDAQKETTQKKLKAYIPKHRVKDITYVKKGVWGEIVLDNDNKINFKSYEQGREKFQGAGKRLVWFDEEPPHDIWEECFVRQEAGQPFDIIMTMTPIKGMTWVYDDIYLDTDNPDNFVSTAGWDDNPWLTEKQKEQMARGLSPEAIQVRRHGKFVKRVGLICNWWDRSKHIRHYDGYERYWTYYEVLDGGFSDPAAYLFIGVDGDDNIHVMKGYREPQLIADEIVNKRNSMTGGMTITSGWIDTDNPRLTQDLMTKGMSLIPVEKLPGGNASWDETLAEKLAEYGKIQKATGEPRLFISDDLVRFDPDKGTEINWLVQEIENLVWLEQVKKTGIEIKPKWDDHRRFHHHFDGLRALAYFLVMYKKRSYRVKEYNKEKWSI